MRRRYRRPGDRRSPVPPKRFHVCVPLLAGRGRPRCADLGRPFGRVGLHAITASLFYQLGSQCGDLLGNVLLLVVVEEELAVAENEIAGGLQHGHHLGSAGWAALAWGVYGGGAGRQIAYPQGPRRRWLPTSERRRRRPGPPGSRW